MATDPNQPPTPTPPPNPGRDQIDKQLAETLKLLADVLDKSRPPTPPVPPTPKSPPDPAAQQQVFARTVLAAVITGLPNLIARVAVGPQISSDPAERAEQIKSLREQRRKSAEDAELGGGGGLVGKGAGVAGAIGGMVAMKFAAVLGPLAIFQQMLIANNSGMGVLHKSVQVLAATLAPAILPVAIVLAAALLELADDIQDGIQPELKEWTKLIIETFPHLRALAKLAAEAAIGLAKIAGGPEAVQKLHDETVRAWVMDARRVGITREEAGKQARSFAASGPEAIIPGRVDAYVAKVLAEWDRQEAAKVAMRERLAADKAASSGVTDLGVANAKGAIQQEGRTREQHAERFDKMAVEKRLTPEQVAIAKPNWLAEYDRAAKEIDDQVATMRAIGIDREGLLAEWKRQTEAFGIKLAPEFEKQLPAIFDRVKAAGRGGPEDLKTLAEGAVARGKSREELLKDVQENAGDLKLTPEQAAAGQKNWMEAYDRARAAADKSAAMQAVLGGAGATAVRESPRSDAPGSNPQGVGTAGLTAAPSPARMARDALGDVVQSLRMSLTTPATIGNVSGIYNQAQLKALNADPLEQRLIDINQKSLDRLEQVINELRGIKTNTMPKAERAHDPMPWDKKR